MKKFLLLLPVLALGLAACETTDQNTAAGALGGAVIGAAVTDNNPLQGALIGAAVGVAASTLIGPTGNSGQCYYRNSQGQRYIDRC